MVLRAVSEENTHRNPGVREKGKAKGLSGGHDRFWGLRTPE